MALQHLQSRSLQPFFVGPLSETNQALEPSHGHKTARVQLVQPALFHRTPQPQIPTQGHANFTVCTSITIGTSPHPTTFSNPITNTVNAISRKTWASYESPDGKRLLLVLFIQEEGGWNRWSIFNLASYTQGNAIHGNAPILLYEGNLHLGTNRHARGLPFQCIGPPIHPPVITDQALERSAIAQYLAGKRMITKYSPEVQERIQQVHVPPVQPTPAPAHATDLASHFIVTSSNQWGLPKAIQVLNVPQSVDQNIKGQYNYTSWVCPERSTRYTPDHCIFVYKKGNLSLAVIVTYQDPQAPYWEWGVFKTDPTTQGWLNSTKKKEVLNRTSIVSNLKFLDSPPFFPPKKVPIFARHGHHPQPAVPVLTPSTSAVNKPFSVDLFSVNVHPPVEVEIKNAGAEYNGSYNKQSTSHVPNVIVFDVYQKDIGAFFTVVEDKLTNPIEWFWILTKVDPTQELETLTATHSKLTDVLTASNIVMGDHFSAGQAGGGKRRGKKGQQAAKQHGQRQAKGKQKPRKQQSRKQQAKTHTTGFLQGIPKPKQNFQVRFSPSVPIEQQPHPSPASPVHVSPPTSPVHVLPVSHRRRRAHVLAPPHNLPEDEFGDEPPQLAPAEDETEEEPQEETEEEPGEPKSRMKRATNAFAHGLSFLKKGVVAAASKGKNLHDRLLGADWVKYGTSPCRYADFLPCVKLSDRDILGIIEKVQHQMHIQGMGDADEPMPPPPPQVPVPEHLRSRYHVHTPPHSPSHELPTFTPPHSPSHVLPHSTLPPTSPQQLEPITQPSSPVHTSLPHLGLPQVPSHELNTNQHLPPGWKQYTDDATGVPYYHNASTGQTTWKRPAQTPSTQPLAHPSSHQLTSPLHPTPVHPTSVPQQSQLPSPQPLASSQQAGNIRDSELPIGALPIDLALAPQPPAGTLVPALAKELDNTMHPLCNDVVRLEQNIDQWQGIVNAGNTCFLAATLKCVARTNIIESACAQQYQGSHLNPHGAINIQSYNVLINSLLNIFDGIRRGDPIQRQQIQLFQQRATGEKAHLPQVVNYLFTTSAEYAQGIGTGAQHDAHEALLAIIDLLTFSLGFKVLEYRITYAKQPNNMLRMSSVQEQYIDPIVHIPLTTGYHLDLTIADYIQTEYMSATDSDASHVTLNRLSADHPPHFLVAYIPRKTAYETVMQQGMQYRQPVPADKPVPFSPNVQINVFANEQGTLVSKHQLPYHAVAVAVHVGHGSAGGHYVAFIKDQSNNWYLNDDGAPAQQATIVNPNGPAGDVYARQGPTLNLNKDPVLVYYVLNTFHPRPVLQDGGTLVHYPGVPIDIGYQYGGQDSSLFEQGNVAQTRSHIAQFVKNASMSVPSYLPSIIQSPSVPSAQKHKLATEYAKLANVLGNISSSYGIGQFVDSPGEMKQLEKQVQQAADQLNTSAVEHRAKAVAEHQPEFEDNVRRSLTARYKHQRKEKVAAAKAKRKTGIFSFLESAKRKLTTKKAQAAAEKTAAHKELQNRRAHELAEARHPVTEDEPHEDSEEVREVPKKKLTKKEKAKAKAASDAHEATEAATKASQKQRKLQREVQELTNALAKEKALERRLTSQGKTTEAAAAKTKHAQLKQQLASKKKAHKEAVKKADKAQTAAEKVLKKQKLAAGKTGFFSGWFSSSAKQQKKTSLGSKKFKVRCPVLKKVTAKYDPVFNYTNLHTNVLASVLTPLLYDPHKMKCYLGIDLPTSIDLPDAIIDAVSEAISQNKFEHRLAHELETDEKQYLEDHTSQTPHNPDAATPSYSFDLPPRHLAKTTAKNFFKFIGEIHKCSAETNLGQLKVIRDEFVVSSRLLTFVMDWVYKNMIVPLAPSDHQRVLKAIFENYLVMIRTNCTYLTELMKYLKEDETEENTENTDLDFDDLKTSFVKAAKKYTQELKKLTDLFEAAKKRDTPTVVQVPAKFTLPDIDDLIGEVDWNATILSSASCGFLTSGKMPAKEGSRISRSPIKQFSFTVGGRKSTAFAVGILPKICGLYKELNVKNLANVLTQAIYAKRVPDEETSYLQDACAASTKKCLFQILDEQDMDDYKQYFDDYAQYNKDIVDVPVLALLNKESELCSNITGVVTTCENADISNILTDFKQFEVLSNAGIAFSSHVLETMLVESTDENKNIFYDLLDLFIHLHTWIQSIVSATGDLLVLGEEREETVGKKKHKRTVYKELPSPAIDAQKRRMTQAVNEANASFRELESLATTLQQRYQLQKRNFIDVYKGLMHHATQKLQTLQVRLTAQCGGNPMAYLFGMLGGAYKSRGGDPPTRDYSTLVVTLLTSIESDIEAGEAILKQLAKQEKGAKVLRERAAAAVMFMSKLMLQGPQKNLDSMSKDLWSSQRTTVPKAMGNLTKFIQVTGAKIAAEEAEKKKAAAEAAAHAKALAKAKAKAAKRGAKKGRKEVDAEEEQEEESGSRNKPRHGKIRSRASELHPSLGRAREHEFEEEHGLGSAIYGSIAQPLEEPSEPALVAPHVEEHSRDNRGRGNSNRGRGRGRHHGRRGRGRSRGRGRGHR